MYETDLLPDCLLDLALSLNIERVRIEQLSLVLLLELGRILHRTQLREQLTEPRRVVGRSVGKLRLRLGVQNMRGCRADELRMSALGAMNEGAVAWCEARGATDLAKLGHQPRVAQDLSPHRLALRIQVPAPHPTPRSARVSAGGWVAGRLDSSG